MQPARSAVAKLSDVPRRRMHAEPSCEAIFGAPVSDAVEHELCRRRNTRTGLTHALQRTQSRAPTHMIGCDPEGPSERALGVSKVPDSLRRTPLEAVPVITSCTSF